MGFLFRGVLWGLLLPVPESGVITLISGNAVLSAQPSLTFCLHLLLLALRHQVSVLLMSLSTAVGPESQVEQIAAPSPYTLCLLPGDIVHRVPSQATSFQSEEISSFRPVCLLPLGCVQGKVARQYCGSSLSLLPKFTGTMCSPPHLLLLVLVFFCFGGSHTL